jgi:hypothetical protein
MLLKNRISIIFLHFNRSDVTLHNFELIKKYNPTKNIYPVGFSGCDLIDGSHVVNKSKLLYPTNQIFEQIDETPIEWYEADILIYDFYKSHSNLPVYFILEWDTYCNCSLEEFYGDKLNLSNFGHSIRTGEKLEDWYWYKQLTDEQKTMRDIGGIGPTSCLLFTNKLLSLMVDRITSNPRQYDNMFSELRMGTLVQQSGYILNEINNENITWNDSLLNVDKNVKGYYHPVKKLVA